MLRLIEHWFEPVHASQEYRQQDYILLVVILAVGTWLRFWHLDNVGLHGDEDIVALAVRGVVEQGVPILPSGMYYPRALIHTYLLAGSTILFGDNEWALRLPSAIVGSLCGLFAFLMGRRFLEPKPNLVFVALIMFLPAMIDVSLTARMYVFFVAGLLIFATLLFRWERTGKVTSFLMAFVAWLVTVHLHPLAVFAAPMFLFPGLANRSWKQVMVGAISTVSAVVISAVLGHIAGQNYPDESEQLMLPPDVKQTPLELLFQGQMRLALVVAIAAATVVVMIGILRVERWKEVLPAVLLLAIGVTACVLLHYHLGGIALLFGSILWCRAAVQHHPRLLFIGAVVIATVIVQFLVLHGTGEFPGRTLIGAFVGTPSVWPMLRFAEFSPLGIVVFAVTFTYAVYRLALRHRIPEHYLFFAIAVWAPLFAIGLVRWDVAERYTLGALPFFLLAVVAGAAYLEQGTGWKGRLRENSMATVAVVVVLVGAIINPGATWQASKNDYRNHPDHKGAAEFMRSLPLSPSDIIIAEDSINQTYYLGHVDYRLQNYVGAKNHSVLRGDVLYDQYTNVPVIGTGDDFERVLERDSAGNIYVISSAQVSEGLMQRNRAEGIAEVLESERMARIFVGRDGRTTVWKVRRPVSNQAHRTPAKDNPSSTH